ncbi:MAG: hypothetical protein ACI8QC_003999 [Planctomycetota bacterium]|jgi:hypothetical protein
MADPRFPYVSEDPEAIDSKQADLGFGEGGVPFILLLLYLSFLVFFTWYTMDFQLPEFLKDGPVAIESDVGPASE